MKKKKSEKGVTLIEIIVSIALLGLMCVSFIPLFYAGSNLIYLSGQRSNTQYDAAQAIENKLSNPTATVPGVNETAASFTIKFGNVSIPLSGKIITSTSSVNKVVSTVKAFIPD